MLLPTETSTNEQTNINFCYMQRRFSAVALQLKKCAYKSEKTWNMSKIFISFFASRFSCCDPITAFEHVVFPCSRATLYMHLKNRVAAVILSIRAVASSPKHNILLYITHFIELARTHTHHFAQKWKSWKTTVKWYARFSVHACILQRIFNMNSVLLEKPLRAF